MTKAFICNSSVRLHAEGNGESHKDLTQEWSINGNIQALVTDEKTIGKPIRSYYNNSGEKWWAFELSSNEHGGMWSDVRDIKNEAIVVTDSRG